MVLTSKTNEKKVDEAISNGHVVSVPSNEVIAKMYEAYKGTETTGNEHGFVVATDGTTSTLREGGPSSVGLRNQYYELEDAGKTSSYDVHTHPNEFDSNGNVVAVGAPQPSGGAGNKPDDVETYGKDGPNDSPSVVLGYKVTRRESQTEGTTTTTTKQVRFYDGKGAVGDIIDYNQLKKAVKTINGE